MNRKDTVFLSLINPEPKHPKSNYAVTGLYFYDNDVINKAYKLKPSGRGELEITDLNLLYLKEKRLKVELLGRGFSWLDTGTTSSLLQASNYIQAIQERQGLKIACIEEIAYRLGYINNNEIKNIAREMKGNEYGKYLLNIIKKENLLINYKKNDNKGY